MTTYLALAALIAIATFTALAWDLGWRLDLKLRHLDSTERTDS